MQKVHCSICQRHSDRILGMLHVAHEEGVSMQRCMQCWDTDWSWHNKDILPLQQGLDVLGALILKGYSTYHPGPRAMNSVAVLALYDKNVSAQVELALVMAGFHHTVIMFRRGHLEYRLASVLDPLVDH